MLDFLLHNFSTVMLVGVILIVGLGQFNRVLASILAIGFWIATAVAATFVYGEGGQLGLAGTPLSLNVVYGLCGAFTLVNIATLWSAMKKAQLRKEHREILSKER